MIIDGRRIITFVVHKEDNYVIQLADTENRTAEGYKRAEFGIIPENIGRITSLFTNDKYAFVGFGNKYKDNIILNYVIKNRNFLETVNSRFITEAVEKTLKEILEEQNPELIKQYKYVNEFNSFDLQRFLFSKEEMMSLEAFVKASDYKYTDSEHDAQNIANILDENKPRIDARLKIEEIYGEDLFDGHEGVVGARLIKSLYAKQNSLKMAEIKPSNISCRTIDFKDIILPVIKFQSDQLNMLLEDLSKISIGIDENWSYYVSYKNLSMIMNLAGLRMNTDPVKMVSDNEGDVYCIDIASFYPTISHVYGIAPRSVNESFQGIFGEMLGRRLEFKNTDQEVSTAMKYMLNGIIGQFMIEGSWLYDPMTSFKIRINGALLMLMLIEKLYGSASIQCITIDGMFIKTKMDFNSIRSLIDEWTSETNLHSYTKKYDWVYMLGNNDYITSDGTKKGFFSEQGNNGKIRKPDIVKEAVIQKLVNDVPVVETITRCDDLGEFVSSVSSTTPMEWCGSVFNNARFYYSRDQKINKINDSSAFNVTMTPMTQDGVTITDTMTIEMPDNIDYQHYIMEANRIVEKLNAQQLNLFQ